MQRCVLERIIRAVRSNGGRRSAAIACAASCSGWLPKKTRHSAQAARSGCSTRSRPKKRPSMRDVVVVEALRTPIGRYGGALAAVRPDDLAAIVVKAVVERSGIDPARIDDVLLGAANQ